MSLLQVLLALQLIVAATFAQCPSGNPFGVLCDDNAPAGAWRSEITGEILSSSEGDSASFTWLPDPDIEPRQRAYRIAIRRFDVSGTQFELGEQTRPNTYTVENLEFDARYEVLVCYENITVPSLQMDSSFIENCGYCRTCFGTSDQSGSTGAFINITSTTMWTFSSPTDDSDIDVYVCRAVGSSSALAIRWRAFDPTAGSNTLLSNNNQRQGVEVSRSVEGDEEVSVLRLSRDTVLQSISCRVNIGNSLTASEANFEFLGTVNITNATVTSLSQSRDEFEVYTCQGFGNSVEITISWLAHNTSGVVELSNSSMGVLITDSMMGNNMVRSELRLPVDGVYTAPVCRVTAGNGLVVDQAAFIELVESTTEEPETSEPPEVDVTKTVPLPVYAIVLIVVVPILILPPLMAIGSVTFYKRCHKKKEKKEREATAIISEMELDRISRSSTETIGTLSKQGEDANAILILKQMLPQDAFIDPADLNVSLVIGQGEFGVIYKAYLQWNGNKTKETVAVKTLKGIFATSSDISKATEEILKMRNFDHPNVMTLIGVCVAPSEEGQSSVGPSIIMPFMAKGSLLDYLRNEADNLFAANEDEVLSVRKTLVIICQQIARGMQYLASLKFVHRDLAARNCLMNEHGVIKVSDFGLTEDIYTQNYFRQAKDGAKLPLKWMAPESIKLGVFTEKTDVWSFGVTCWEVFNGGAIPYPGINPREILEILEEGKRLSRPKNFACCCKMYGIMKSCWDQRPDSRPTFSELVRTLENYLASTADYVDLTGLRTDCDELEGASTSQEVSSVKTDTLKPQSLVNRVPAEPNDYSIADL